MKLFHVEYKWSSEGCRQHSGGHSSLLRSFTSSKNPGSFKEHEFIAVFKRTRHWILSKVSSVLPTPSSVLILSFHVRQGLPSELLPLGFPTQILSAFLISPIRATCLAPVIFSEIIRINVNPDGGRVSETLDCNSILTAHRPEDFIAHSGHSQSLLYRTTQHWWMGAHKDVQNVVSSSLTSQFRNGI